MPAQTDKDAEAVAAIEELVADIGLLAVVSAVLKSSIGDHLGQVGGNATLRIAQVILRRIAFSKNPQLEAEIMALGSGIILAEGENMTKVAKKWGITRAAVSKRVLQFADEYGLPPSQYMRKTADRKTYALCNQPRSS